LFAAEFPKVDQKQIMQKYHMMNKREWPSLYSYYLQDGGRLPGDQLLVEDGVPDWSPVPPVIEGLYWVYDIETRTVSVMHLYRLEDETVADPLTINVYAIAGLNPDCDSMAGKVLYGGEAIPDWGDLNDFPKCEMVS
jgi:hypothetical protein